MYFFLVKLKRKFGIGYKIQDEFFFFLSLSPMCDLHINVSAALCHLLLVTSPAKEYEACGGSGGQR